MLAHSGALTLWLTVAGALGSPFQVADPPVAGTRGQRSSNPSVCVSDGGEGFVAWEDDRCGHDVCIVGSRIDASGLLRDPNGVSLAPSGVNPKVACGLDGDPTSFLVTWTAQAIDVWGNLVRGDAGISVPFSIFSGNGAHFDAAAASAGGRYLVAWVEQGTVTSIFASVLEPDGGTAVAPHLIAAQVAGQPFNVHVTSAGTEYLVSWQEAQTVGLPNVLGQRVDLLGTPQGVTRGLGVGSTYDVTWNAGGWVVVREVGTGVMQKNFHNQILTAVTPDEDVNATGTFGSQPSLTSSGGNAYAVWTEDSASLKATQLNASVPPIVTMLNPVSVADPVIAARPTGFFGAATWRNDGDTYVRTFLSSSGFTTVNPEPVSSMSQRMPNAAAIGDTHLVTWLETNGAGRALRARRFDRDGNGLEAGSLTLENRNTVEPAAPQVVALGNEWLVVWRDARANAAWGRRVSVSGQVLDATPVLLLSSGETVKSVALAADGTQYLAAWEGASGVFVRLFSSTLAPTSAVTSVGSGSLLGDQPVAAAGSRAGFLVAWQTSTRVGAARVSSTGTVLDPGGVPLFTGSAGMRQPTVAWDGQQFHVSAQNGGSWLETGFDGGAPISPTGVAIPNGDAVRFGQIVAIAGGLAAASSEVVVNSGPATLNSSRLSVAFAVDGGWVQQHVLDARDAQLSFPRISNGQSSRLYFWAQHSPSGGGPRVFGRAEPLGNAGELCTQFWQCASGVCANGACVGGPTAPDAGGTGGGGGGAGGGSGGGGGAEGPGGSGGSTGGGAGGGGGGEAGGAGGEGGGAALPGRFSVGCGCSSGGELLGLWLCALWLRRRLSA